MPAVTGQLRRHLPQNVVHLPGRARPVLASVFTRHPRLALVLDWGPGRCGLWLAVQVGGPGRAPSGQEVKLSFIEDLMRLTCGPHR